MSNILNRLTCYIYSLIILIYSMINIYRGLFLPALQSVVLIIILWIITFKYYYIFKDNMLLFMTNLFIFAAGYLGLVLHFYDKIWFYDLVIHFYAGVMLIQYGLLVIAYLKQYQIKINNDYLLALFLLFFSISMLLLWEFLEYVLDLLWNTDHTHYEETGLHDTMSDLMVGIAGSLLTLWWLKDKISVNITKKSKS
ncbi:MAG: hypothetical protein ACOWWR_15570 [Eubacteriales bacterium]